MLLTKSVMTAMVAFISFSSDAWAFGSKPLPWVMGVLGDSISAGTLADLRIPRDDNVQPEFVFENKSTLSWASGRRIQSHLVRLRKYLKEAGDERELWVENLAVPGDNSSGLRKQAEKFVEAAQSGKYSGVKYITLLIGANDVCSPETPRGVPLDKVRQNILTAFAVLSRIKQEEPIRILMVGIPRIPELGVPSIRNSHTVLGLSCHTVRNGILRFCNSLLNWKTDDEFDEKMSIVEDMNRLLRSIAAEASLEFPNLDVAYSDRLSHRVVPRDYLAIDCFHPNATGQTALADETWVDQPWFGSVEPKWECKGVKIGQVGPAAARNGDETTYLVHLSNDGNCDLGPAKLTDFIPRRSYYQSAMPLPSATAQTPVGAVSWESVRLSPKETLDFRVSVRLNGPAGRTSTNTVCFEHPRTGRICSSFDTLVTR